MPRLNGDLRAVIDGEMKLHSAPPFPEPVALHIMMQLAMGLKGLHEAEIYHRGLKADNILVEEMALDGLDSDSYGVQISDFESSKDVTGTKFYRAPEVLRCVQAQMEDRGHERARLPEHEWGAADVYSFGMVCYEILTGEVPMIGDKWSDYSMALSGLRPELPPSMIPEDLRIMIERCWHEDPQCRPTPSEIINYVSWAPGIQNNEMARTWFTRLESMATLEVTTGNLEDHVEELERLLRYILLILNSNPTLNWTGREFLVHVREFIPKFHAFSSLPQQSFPLQKYMELRKLLSLIDLRKCSFLKGTTELIAAGDDWLRKNYDWLGMSEMGHERDWMRMAELVKKIHAATNKTSLQRSRLAPADGLPIDEKKALLRDFVEPQLAAGVWMQYVCTESEITIRQMSDTKHRWALRCHLLFLCVIHRLRSEVANEVASFVQFVVMMLFTCKVLGWILVLVLGKDYSLFWYFDMSPAIGYQLALMRYVGYREHSLWYWRLYYYYIVGNGEGFKYLCLTALPYNIVRNYTAYVQTSGLTVTFNLSIVPHTVLSST